MRLEGIEPPSQEPESHVISITLQAHLNNINNFTGILHKKQDLETEKIINGQISLS